MFGYCHNDECALDLWGPTWHPETLSHHHHIENRAFSPYAKHQQELEDIIECILETAVDSEENITISSYDDLSDSDVEYIEKEVRRRWYNE